MGRPANATDDAFFPYTPKRIARGVMKRGKPAAWIRFTPTLFKAIQDEAIQRGWSFGRMVNHLCEASIEGIE